MTDDDEKHRCINNVKQHFNISQCQSIKKITWIIIMIQNNNDKNCITMNGKTNADNGSNEM
jgi:uncharacterized membrane protein YjjP (DUF1212 family)